MRNRIKMSKSEKQKVANKGVKLLAKIEKHLDIAAKLSRELEDVVADGIRLKMIDKFLKSQEVLRSAGATTGLINAAACEVYINHQLYTEIAQANGVDVPMEIPAQDDGVTVFSGGDR